MKVDQCVLPKLQFVGTSRAYFKQKKPYLFTFQFQVQLRSRPLKGTSGRKKSYPQMKEGENAKNEPLPTSTCQMVFEIFHFKVRNWARWTSPFRRFSASFSIKYDVTDSTVQDIERNESAISQKSSV